MQLPSNQNPAAHNAVLQSDFYFQQQTAESIQKSISFAQEAVRLDPNYALAYAKLSQAWRQYAASFATGDARKRTTKPATPRTKLLLSRPTWSKCERLLAGYR